MDVRGALRPPHFDYEFEDEERDNLLTGLLGIKTSPYNDHSAFLEEVGMLSTTDFVSPTFREFAAVLKMKDKVAHPITLVSNAPIDPTIPEFDWVDPVVSKRKLKKTFVCEGFLALFAHLQARPVVGHLSVNDGDFYHDIFPKKDMAETQSQKTEKTLYFHKDFTNHFARPDCVYTLTIRNSTENEVISTYVSNAEVIRALSPDTLEVLRQPLFATPFDDVSKLQQNVELGERPNHAILEHEVELRVFEQRTTATTQESSRALDDLLHAMHKLKTGLHQKPGDFVAIENDFCLHGREVHRVNSPVELRRRWLMKTHNVTSLSKLSRFFMQDRPAVING